MVSKFLKAEGSVLALVYWAVGRVKVAAEQIAPTHGGPQADGVTLPLQPLTVPHHGVDTEAQGPALVSRQAGSIPGGLSLGPVSLPCACSPCRAHSASPRVPFPPSCGWVPWIPLLRALPFTPSSAGGHSPAST